MSKLFLEEFITNYTINEEMYLSINDISRFNNEITLFDYQTEAIKKLVKLMEVLKLYSFNFEKYKGHVLEAIKKTDVDIERLNVEKGTTIKSAERFELLASYYDQIEDGVISVGNFLNRAAFWMATGSGKSLIIVKAIEYLYDLMNRDELPKKEILLLLPNENIINQFKNLINDYNASSKNRINLVKLDRFSEQKRESNLLNEIDVFYYRSDLLRDSTANSIIDFKDYENQGNWYVFLDEAHKGETGSSNIQDYISIISRNGFLFNFSATFTDEIDYITTLYNFNLEKFITSGYGKNIFLPPSSFKFRESKNELDDREKNIQVMKSIISLTLIKKNKIMNLYHNPLMVVLVNSINTENSDLLMFFKEIEKIAVGNVDGTIFNKAKEELYNDFKNGGYIFNCPDFERNSPFFNRNQIINISEKDVLEYVFNAESTGKIELIEGEIGKEIALKLTTSEKPFGLIKIGDADKFKREKLGQNYISYKSIIREQFFRDINDVDSPFNILFGSRSFYEGWDSNRPNVMNFINIGGSEAKKFVLQALGRGVRIEPTKGRRNRLPATDINKNHLLETLFVFATDNKGIQTVLETLKNEKQSNNILLSNYMSETTKNIKLLIPKYKTIKNIEANSKFAISSETFDELKKYFLQISVNTFIVRFHATLQEYYYLKTSFLDNSFFMVNESKNYIDLTRLMGEVLEFIRNDKEIFYKINELENEIIHFREITVSDLTGDALTTLCDKINKAKELTSEKKEALKLSLIKNDISFDEFKEAMDLNIGNYELINIANHLYLPIILSHDERQMYIKNIIKEPSEVEFMKSLNNWLEKNSKSISSNWMFSILIENTDSVYIPYFDPASNKYRKFNPDFVFWIEQGNSYTILFIDPKGTSHTDYIFKIKGYEETFMENSIVKKFKFDDSTVDVQLKMVTEDLNKIPAEYQKFWIEKGNFHFLK